MTEPIVNNREYRIFLFQFDGSKDNYQEVFTKLVNHKKLQRTKCILCGVTSGLIQFLHLRKTCTVEKFVRSTCSDVAAVAVEGMKIYSKNHPKYRSIEQICQDIQKDAFKIKGEVPPEIYQRSYCQRVLASLKRSMPDGAIIDVASLKRLKLEDGIDGNPDKTIGGELSLATLHPSLLPLIQKLKGPKKIKQPKLDVTDESVERTVNQASVPAEGSDSTDSEKPMNVPKNIQTIDADGTVINNITNLTSVSIGTESSSDMPLSKNLLKILLDTATSSDAAIAMMTSSVPATTVITNTSSENALINTSDSAMDAQKTQKRVRKLKVLAQPEDEVPAPVAVENKGQDNNPLPVTVITTTSSSTSSATNALLAAATEKLQKAAKKQKLAHGENPIVVKETIPPVTVAVTVVENPQKPVKKTKSAIVNNTNNVIKEDTNGLPAVSSTQQDGTGTSKEKAQIAVNNAQKGLRKVKASLMELTKEEEQQVQQQPQDTTTTNTTTTITTSCFPVPVSELVADPSPVTEVSVVVMRNESIPTLNVDDVSKDDQIEGDSIKTTTDSESSMNAAAEVSLANVCSREGTVIRTSGDLVRD